jgi:hypothetical protein
MTHREHLLDAMRRSRAHLRWVCDEIDAIGIMLRAGGISNEEAQNWLDDIGALQFVGESSFCDLDAFRARPYQPVITHQGAAQ